MDCQSFCKQHASGNAQRLCLPRGMSAQQLVCPEDMLDVCLCIHMTWAGDIHSVLSDDCIVLKDDRCLCLPGSVWKDLYAGHHFQSVFTGSPITCLYNLED